MRLLYQSLKFGIVFLFFYLVPECFGPQAKTTALKQESDMTATFQTIILTNH